MKKTIDILRKLGIFRSGSVSGTYTSEKDRPTEFLMGDVFDAKKDLVNEKDIKGAKNFIMSQNKPNLGKISMARKIFFWSIVILGLLFLIIFLSTGFSFRFVIDLLIWFGLIWMLRKFAFEGAFSWMLAIFISIVILFISLMLYPGSESGISVQSLKQYDRKIYDISGEDGKVGGTAAIQVKERKDGKAYLSVTYHFFIKDKFAMIPSSYCDNSTKVEGYHYSGNLLKPLSEEKSNAVGVFSQAYCNKDARPEDLFSSDSKIYQCSKPVMAGTVTDTFVPSFSDNFYSIEEFLAANTYEVYDASNAWDKEEDRDGCVSNDDKAVSQGKKVRSYSFVLTER